MIVIWFISFVKFEANCLETKIKCFIFSSFGERKNGAKQRHIF